MADSKQNVLSVIATTRSRLSDLVIRDGQLIFLRDNGRVAFDWGGVRTFYNQITELDSELERENLENPVNGRYFFVIETAVLWTYQNGWVQLTRNEENVVFIDEAGVSGLGKPRTLYVNETKKEISIWNESKEEFVVVADAKGSISQEQISSLFA